MPWSLILSVLPLISLLGVFVYYEVRNEKKRKILDTEAHDSIKPVAKIADDLHKKKYGRPSSELVQTFPDLKAIK